MGSRLRRREGAWIEIERCVGCQHHQYCTSHSEEKYDQYQRELTAAVSEASDHQRLPVEINPGPDVGTTERVQQVGSDETMFKTLVRSIHSKGWMQDRIIRYPRLGAFEVWLCFRSSREEVFSKLKTGRWPNPQWLAERILKVAERLNVWDEASPSSCSVFAVPEKAPSGFVASKRSEVTSAPRFGVAEVEDGANVNDASAAKPAEVLAAPRANETAKSVIEVTKAPEVSAKPIELPGAGSDLSSRLKDAQPLTNEAESSAANMPDTKADPKPEMEQEKKDKKDKKGNDSPWDEEFEDFEEFEEDGPAEETSAAVPTNEDKGKSFAVRVPSDQDEYATDFEEDDHPEVAGLGSSSSRTIQPANVMEKTNVKEVETVEVEGQVPKTGDVIATLPDSQGDSQPADETDMRRQPTHDWEEDFEVDDGEDPANGTASKASAKDTTEPSMTTNVASKNEVESEPTEESPGPEKATGSESSLLPVEAQTLGTSVPSSSLMASQSENGNQMDASTGQKAKTTPQEEAVLPNGGTASEIVPAQKGLGPVDDDHDSFEEDRNPGTLQAEMASRTETEVEEGDVEIPEVEEVSSPIELPSAEARSKPSSELTNLEYAQQAEKPSTDVKAENSLIKQSADGLDSSEGKGRSSAVKVPEDQDEYAEAFEQDDHTETAEPEKANVKEVEAGEVEGQVPKTGDVIATLPDSQGDSQPADETDMRRQSTHDWEEDFEVDDGEDPANGTASKASAKDTTEPSMTTNVASKNEVESEPTEESPGPEKATGSESSLLPVEAQTLGTSVPSSSLMVSQSENGNQMDASTGQKAKATPQEEAVLPNGSTTSEIVPAQKGTSNEVVEEERQSSKNSDFKEYFPEGSQAKVASRPETEIEETNSMEVKGVEEVDSTQDSWLQATLGRNGQVLQLVMTSQPEDVIEVDVDSASKSPAEAAHSGGASSSSNGMFACKDKADFGDAPEPSKAMTPMAPMAPFERVGSNPAEPLRFVDPSPSRRSDFEDVFDDPLLSTSFGNDETSDSGDFPDFEDPMVEVEEECSVPMFGDFDKERLPTVNEIDEDEEGESNFEVQMDAKVPTFDAEEPEEPGPGEASLGTTSAEGTARTAPRVRPTSARIRAGRE